MRISNRLIEIETVRYKQEKNDFVFVVGINCKRIFLNYFSSNSIINAQRDSHSHDHMVVGFTTRVMSSNPTHWSVYSIQHYMIEFVSFFPGTPVSSTNKTECHHIAEILLKVVLTTKTTNLYNKMDIQPKLIVILSV